MSEKRRGCFTCKNLPLCYLKHNMDKALERCNMLNIDGTATPGRWHQIYEALGNCCIRYELSLEDT
jgi:hypothetical protein